MSAMNVSEEPVASIVCAAGGGRRFLRNAGNHLQGYTILTEQIIELKRLDLVKCFAQ
jgi:hypothetical protein